MGSSSIGKDCALRWITYDKNEAHVSACWVDVRYENEKSGNK